MKIWLKNTLSVLGIAAIGFVLLNILFLLAAGFQTLLRLIVGIFIEIGPETNIFWLQPLSHFLFFALILLASFFLMKSKLKPFFKAIFLIVPVAVVLVTLGIFLSNFPYILYPLGILLVLTTLFIFYKTKQPWLYYYSVLLISIALMIFTLLGGEI